jgi:bacteriocin resistance YdeI/OmpD-like protein/uncharacterized protein DUF1905
MNSRRFSSLDGMQSLEKKTAGVTFRATVGLAGKTATGVVVPADVVEALGSQRQPLVRVTIGDHTYRSKVAVRGGEFKLPISAENREGAGVAAGDEIEVTLELDTEPREVALPDDFAHALDAAPEARRFFEGLSNSQKQWFVQPIEGAKTSGARERRIVKAVERLRQGRSNR